MTGTNSTSPNYVIVTDQYWDGLADNPLVPRKFASKMGISLRSLQQSITATLKLLN